MHKFKMGMFDGESIAFPYKSIIVCNKNIMDRILNNEIKVEAPIPYIIFTDDKLTDEEVNILEDASIGDCLNLYKNRPAFGGILL